MEYDLILRWGVGELTMAVVRDDLGRETTGAVFNTPEFRALSPEEQTAALVKAASKGHIPSVPKSPEPTHPVISLAVVEGRAQDVPEEKEDGKGGKGIREQRKGNRGKAGHK